MSPLPLPPGMNLVRIGDGLTLQRAYGQLERVSSTDVGMNMLQIVRMRLDPGKSTRLHSHPYEEAFIVIDGHVDIGGKEATTGDCVLVPPNEPHSVTNLDDVQQSTLILALAPPRDERFVQYLQ